MYGLRKFKVLKSISTLGTCQDCSLPQRFGNTKVIYSSPTSPVNPSVIIPHLYAPPMRLKTKRTFYLVAKWTFLYGGLVESESSCNSKEQSLNNHQGKTMEKKSERSSKWQVFSAKQY